MSGLDCLHALSVPGSSSANKQYSGSLFLFNVCLMLFVLQFVLYRTYTKVSRGAKMLLSIKYTFLEFWKKKPKYDIAPGVKSLSKENINPKKIVCFSFLIKFFFCRYMHGFGAALTLDDMYVSCNNKCHICIGSCHIWQTWMKSKLVKYDKVY